MTTYLIDTFAWVEYFRGTEKGGMLRNLLNNSKNEFITIECCIAELKMWTIKSKINFQAIFEVVQANSTLCPIILEDWLNAAEIREEMRKTRKKFGLIDALLLSKQKQDKCKLISGDPHFKNLPNVAFM